MAENETVQALAEAEYKHGWSSEVESDQLPPGLNEDTVRAISAKKNEPEWLTEWRLRAFRHWLTMAEPDWQKPKYPKIDYQGIIYYSAPKKKVSLDSLDEVDPELLETFEKLGISLDEQKRLTGVAVDAVFDSVSVKTTFREELSKQGIVFCSFSEAVTDHPELVKKYLGSVVPYTDNYFATLNSAVFSDGSFCYIPKGVRCPMELSTYFRINTAGTGQFERTLLIADEGAYVSYLEGCTAPQPRREPAARCRCRTGRPKRRAHQVQHGPELVPRRQERQGRRLSTSSPSAGLPHENAKVSWTQVETGSAITWKYPSCMLKGDNSVGEFYSVALTRDHQMADTGTKMVHIGKNTKSTIISKGISAGQGDQTYRGLVKILPKAEGARNYSVCDSLLIGGKCGAHTVPYIESSNKSAVIEHEASTSKISDDQIFFLRQRGLSEEDAVSMIVNGFCKDVLSELPMEFAVEAQKLLGTQTGRRSRIEQVSR